MSDDLDDLSLGSSSLPLIPRVVSDYCDTYRHSYIMQLPKTTDGFMFHLQGGASNEPFLEEYFVSVGKYITHPDGKKCLAEEFNIFRNQDDIILALDGEDLSGVSVTELLQRMVCKEVGSTAVLTILDRERFKSGLYRNVRIGTFRLVNVPITN